LQEKSYEDVEPLLLVLQREWLEGEGVQKEEPMHVKATKVGGDDVTATSATEKCTQQRVFLTLQEYGPIQF